MRVSCCEPHSQLQPHLEAQHLSLELGGEPEKVDNVPQQELLFKITRPTQVGVLNMDLPADALSPSTLCKLEIVINPLLLLTLNIGVPPSLLMFTTTDHHRDESPLQLYIF